jgi:hypothetical protein|tara:strand:- start:103 stop:225 length:123 start_codon:yes stop_codon:yes gene_type:complete
MNGNDGGMILGGDNSIYKPVLDEENCCYVAMANEKRLLAF